MRARSIPAATPVTSSIASTSALKLTLREARRLHRAAHGQAISSALPVIRRLHAAGIFPALSVTTLYHQRQQIQRKHLLRLLALEAGHPAWEYYRPHLLQLDPAALTSLHIDTFALATLNHWFASEQEAQAFASAHGGRVLRYGRQAVVLPDDMKLAA